MLPVFYDSLVGDREKYAENLLKITRRIQPAECNWPKVTRRKQLVETKDQRLVENHIVEY